MRLQPFLYFAGILLLLYVLKVTVIVNAVNNSLDTWNYIIDYVLYFKDKQPLVFLSLPMLLFYLMRGK